MAFKISGKIDASDVVARLRDLEKKTRTKLTRKAATAAGKILYKSMRANLTAKRTGTLRKSLGQKVKLYKNGVAVAIAGPRKGFKTTDDFGRPVDPVNYAHLVELGRGRVEAGTQTRTTKAGSVRTTKTGKRLLRFRVKGGAWISASVVRAVAARPFIRPALDNNHGTIRSAMAEVLRAGLAEKGA